MKLRRLTRAEYWWQPLQLPRRAWRRHVRVRAGRPLTVRLPWGHPITIDPGESIGRSVLALNVLDLPVTEALWRLLDEGETAADVGANIGCMTSVMAARLCQGGAVWAFEPMPELAERLRRNVSAWRDRGAASIVVRETAVSDHAGVATLYTPGDWSLNQGTASLTADPSASSRVVTCRRLDDEFADNRIAPHVLKLDVEGGEAAVLRGAQRLLASGRIRDVVFEEWRPFPAESAELLRQAGYAVFRIVRRFFGPGLRDPAAAPAAELDPPTYLATRDSARALRRFRPRGWRSLRTRISRARPMIPAPAASAAVSEHGQKSGAAAPDGSDVTR